MLIYLVQELAKSMWKLYMMVIKVDEECTECMEIN